MAPSTGVGVNAILCTENKPYVVSAELLVSIDGASYSNHNWSSALFDGTGAGGAGTYNQDTGTNLTRTVTKNGVYPNESLVLDFTTADPPIGTNGATFNADVVASSYTIHQISITYASGSLPVLCESSSPPTVDLTCPTGDLTAGYAITFEETHENSVTSWLWEFNDLGNNTSTETDGDVEFTYYQDGDYTVELTVTGPGGSASDSCAIHILRVGDPGGGGGALYRPLLSTDADTGIDWAGTPLGLFSPAAAWGGHTVFQEGNTAQADDETVVGLSQINAAKVYSVADGTVLGVQLLPAGECDALTDNPFQNGVVCQHSLYGEDPGGDITPFASMQVNTAGMYKVTLSFITGVTLEYYVANAPQYVRVGQELLAGCILGETVPYELVSNTAGVPNQANKNTFWMQALTTDGVQVPILAQMYVEPDADTACNAGGEYSDCLFDPLFQDQGGYTWERQGGVSWADGVTLGPGASITLHGLNMDSATSYGFTVWTEYPSTYGSILPRMTLSIGTTETQFILAEHIRSPWSIAPATHTADEGSLYSIRILNSGGAPFTVLQNCVSAGDANVSPGACYFTNATFDGQLTGWSTSGTVIPDPSGPLNGQIAVMSDLATIGQNVKLYEDGGGGDHEYTMTVEGVLHATANSLIQVRYRFGGGGWVTPSVSGWTYNEQNLTALNQVYRLQFDVPSGTFAGVMEFQFDFTEAGADEVGTSLWLSVYSMCLGDDGGFGHHPGGGGSNWTPGGGCDNSAPPVELQDDFGAWIAYHLHGMENIYYCDVIPQLNQLNNVTYGIYEYAQWTGLYSQAAQANTMKWANNALFPWLGGHLSNIALASGGNLTVDPGGGCHDLFCLLDGIVRMAIGPIIEMVGRIVDTLLSLINTTIDLLVPLVTAIIGLLVTVINGIGGVLGSLINLITAFITGITNAQPAPVPGLPNCAIDPNSSAICAVMYGLDNTIFADEGAYIIPLFIGLLSIIQISWLISKITELIQEVTGSI